MRDFNADEIMAKCPEVIPTDTIPTKPTGGINFKKNPPRKALRGKRPMYSEETHIKAACTYAITGSAAETGRILGIKPEVIRQWKLQPWWPQVIERIRSEKDDELDVKFTKLIDKTVEVINDRLENGDYLYDVKKGELVRKPMNGKDTAVVTSIMVDKRNLIRDKKTIHTEQTAVMDRLKKLADEMAGFVKAKDITKESQRVEATEQEPASAGEDGWGQEALLIGVEGEFSPSGELSTLDNIEEREQSL